MKQRYLPKIASGEMKLAFSVTEPNVGSDTTQLQTTAVRDGDEWVINGRKVWSSNAQQADRVLILTRTTPVAHSARKSKGMSLFFAPMDRSAITIKLIEKMGRHAVDSNELFIDNLRVSHADLVGQEGEGFAHIIAGLNPGAHRDCGRSSGYWQSRSGQGGTVRQRTGGFWASHWSKSRYPVSSR